MNSLIHRVAAITATLCVATFCLSTLLVELLGSLELIRTVKSLIVFSGLFILISAIATAGTTGFLMTKRRSGQVCQRKKRRMRIIAFNGIFILIPSAYFLNQWAIKGNLDTKFYKLQALELIAGLSNLVLMAMNIVDGIKITPKRKVTA